MVLKTDFIGYFMTVKPYMDMSLKFLIFNQKLSRANVSMKKLRSNNLVSSICDINKGKNRIIWILGNLDSSKGLKVHLRRGLGYSAKICHVIKVIYRLFFAHQ